MFECSCDYGDEVFTIFNLKTQKARKTHVCQDCGGEIKPKELYDYWAGLYDGKWESGKTCKVCRQIRTDLQCAPYGINALKDYLIGCEWDSEDLGFE